MNSSVRRFCGNERVMKVRAAIIGLFMLASSAGLIAQEQESRSAARKFDEFVIDNKFAFDDMKTRLDSYLVDGLMMEADSQAYIIFYRGRRGSSLYKPWQIRNYMKMRNFPVNRTKIFYGGYRDEPMMELWILPKGAAAPKSTPAAPPKRKCDKC